MKYYKERKRCEDKEIAMSTFTEWHIYNHLSISLEIGTCLFGIVWYWSVDNFVDGGLLVARAGHDVLVVRGDVATEDGG